MSSQKLVMQWITGDIITGKMSGTAFLFRMGVIIAMTSIILILVTAPVTVMKLVCKSEF